MNPIDLKHLGLSDLPNFIADLKSFNITPPTLAGSTASPQVYAFGDSLSDAGNVYTASARLLPAAPYDAGHFSNGPTWVEDLAQGLGMTVPTPSLTGGTDFAYGGAHTGQETLHDANPLDLGAQLAQFTVQVPTPAANSIYTLSVGSNDVLDAVPVYASDPARAVLDVQQAVANEAGFVASLAQRGAQDFVVMNVPDLGRTPQEINDGNTQTASRLAALYDSDLNSALATVAAQNSVSIHMVDAFSLLDQAAGDPAAYGLTNVSTPVWTGSYTGASSGQLNATGSAQGGYLFFDQLHPTSTGHMALAQAAQQSLAGPGLA